MGVLDLDVVCETIRPELLGIYDGRVVILASNASDVEGANLEALYILAMTEIRPYSWIAGRVDAVKAAGTYECADYAKIERVLRRE